MSAVLNIISSFYHSYDYCYFFFINSYYYLIVVVSSGQVTKLYLSLHILEFR